MVLVVAKDQQAQVCSQLPEARVIGSVYPRIGGERNVHLLNLGDKSPVSVFECKIYYF